LSKAEHPRILYTGTLFCDLDLDPMTLKYELDAYSLKTYFSCDSLS